MKRNSTSHDISWFLDINQKDQLILDPPYQRRSVWTPKDRKFFLDTIFRNFPCPPVFIHKEIDEAGNSTYNIVDGKQRLETIIMFSQDLIRIDKDFGDTNLTGKLFSQLSTVFKKIFWNYSITAEYVESIDGTAINEIFDRVNRNAKNLERQELRHAKHDGWFITEVEKEVDDGFWDSVKINTTARRKRMKNIQFVSELLFVLLENKLFGFSQDHLDDMYSLYDEPEETKELFDISNYEMEKTRCKNVISKMFGNNEHLIDYINTFNNYYSLWSLVAFNKKLKGMKRMTDKYLAFMGMVVEISKEEHPDEYVRDHPDYSNALSYYSNSRGASTELPQREARLKILANVLS